MLIVAATQLFIFFLAFTSKIFDQHVLTTIAFSLVLSIVFAFLIIKDPILKMLASNKDSLFREMNLAAEVIMWISFFLIPVSSLVCLLLYGIDFIRYFGDHLFEIKYYGSMAAYLITSFATVSVISSEGKAEIVFLKTMVSMCLNTISIFAVVYLTIFPLIQKFFPLLF